MWAINQWQLDEKPIKLNYAEFASWHRAILSNLNIVLFSAASFV